MPFFSSSSLSINIPSQFPSAASWWLAAAQRHATVATRPTPRIVRNLISSSRRSLSGATATSNHQNTNRTAAFILFMGVFTVTIDCNNHTNNGVLPIGALSYSNCDARIPSSGDVLTFGKVSNEPTTNIPFPALCNGMSLGGVGVRIKYVFVKVYAVGAYFDPIAMMAVKKGNQNDIEKALINPTYPRTIRIVMNRALSMDKFINAIVEAVEPRLKGKNLEKLDEFKELFPQVDLVEGDEIELTIRDDVLLLKTGLGVGTIRSRLFTEAMCDVYFGKDAVSPSLKNDVLKGIPKL